MNWGRTRWLVFAAAVVALTIVFGMFTVSLIIGTELTTAEKWSVGAVMAAFYFVFVGLAAFAVAEIKEDR